MHKLIAHKLHALKNSFKPGLKLRLFQNIFHGGLGGKWLATSITLLGIFRLLARLELLGQIRVFKQRARGAVIGFQHHLHETVLIMIQNLLYEQARRRRIRFRRVCFFVPLACESGERNPLGYQFGVKIFRRVTALGKFQPRQRAVNTHANLVIQVRLGIRVAPRLP